MATFGTWNGICIWPLCISELVSLLLDVANAVTALSACLRHAVGETAAKTGSVRNDPKAAGRSLHRRLKT